MSLEKDALVERVKNDPQFEELVSKRNSLGIVLTILMLIVYFGFIALIAFDKSLLAQPIAAGMATTVGLVVGLGVILTAFVLTAIYVARANSTFDQLNEAIKARALR